MLLLLQYHLVGPLGLVRLLHQLVLLDLVRQSRLLNLLLLFRLVVPLGLVRLLLLLHQLVLLDLVRQSRL